VTAPTPPRPALRWRRWPGPGWPSWTAALPGPLGEDGGFILVGRRDSDPGRCAACGRRTRLWQATLWLPRPFPGGLEAEAGGCTRAHATHVVPTTWQDVAAAFALVATALREDPKPTIWHERLAGIRQRDAERALWLSDQPGTARRLALQLWTTDGALGVADTESVVAAVLQDP
jgi:hypothetical protein